MPSALSQVRAIDGVLPKLVIGALRADIIGATRGGGTYWYDLATPPRLLFEQVIRHLRALVPDGDAFVGAEWWFRATATDTGFPFHFDRDEGIRTKVVSPAVASILYLSNAGGPTLVLDASPSRAAAPRSGIAIDPRPGRFMMFPGTLLHGVLPDRANRWPRVTLLVNWWRSVPRMERDAPPAGVHPVVRAPTWNAPRRALRLPSIDPERLMAKAAWLDILSNQTTYGR